MCEKVAHLGLEREAQQHARPRGDGPRVRVRVRRRELALDGFAVSADEPQVADARAFEHDHAALKKRGAWPARMDAPDGRHLSVLQRRCIGVEDASLGG
jgi:hypothetical protein